MQENQDKYSTKKEIKFLDGIVENKNTLHQRTPGQIKSALQNYIATIQGRRWDDDYCFGFMLEVVELAIAEEREAYKDEINNLKDVVASYEKQSPVAWINKDGTYVELSTKSTVYGSHTIPLIMQHEVVYSSNLPEIFPGTLHALNSLIPKNEVSE